MDTNNSTAKILQFKSKKTVDEGGSCSLCGAPLDPDQAPQYGADDKPICSQCGYKKVMQEIGAVAIDKGMHWLEHGFAEGEIEMLQERASSLIPNFPVSILPTTLPAMLVDLGKQAVANMLMPDAFFFLGMMTSDRLEAVDGNTGQKIISDIDEPLQRSTIGDFIKNMTNAGKGPAAPSQEMLRVKVMLHPLEEWICDHCGALVGQQDGRVAWMVDDDGLVHNFKILHEDCLKQERYTGFKTRPVSPDFVGQCGIGNLLSMLDPGSHRAPGNIVKEIREFATFFARLQYPFYEEARPHLETAEAKTRLGKYGTLAPIPIPELAKICAAELQKRIDAKAQ